MTDERNWIGVDFDKTLAHYNDHFGDGSLGLPIPPMLERVKGWLANGSLVKIFTARVSGDYGEAAAQDQRKKIEAWCQKYLGRKLEVTNCKDPWMVELWDDRAVQVVPNEGITLREQLEDQGEIIY